MARSEKERELKKSQLSQQAHSENRSALFDEYLPWHSTSFCILGSWSLVILAGWVNRQQQEVIDYLRTENQVLKEKLSPAGFCLPTINVVGWPSRPRCWAVSFSRRSARWSLPTRCSAGTACSWPRNGITASAENLLQAGRPCGAEIRPWSCPGPGDPVGATIAFRGPWPIWAMGSLKTPWPTSSRNGSSRPPTQAAHDLEELFESTLGRACRHRFHDH